MTSASELTTTDLAAAIRAKVAEAREELVAGIATYSDWARVQEWSRMCDLADAILARHRRAVLRGEFSGHCECDGHQWPCPDVRDLATAWGIEMKETSA